jgi:hypothetical protein
MQNATAAQSTITIVEGIACMGDDKSRKQTRLAAISDAKRNATEYASTKIESETEVEDARLKKDLISAFAAATVKILEEVHREWYEERGAGDCLRVKIRAEIVPDNEAMTKLEKKQVDLEDPSLPLKVKLWTDKQTYTEGHKIRIYLRGNKPFYARVVYEDAERVITQLLPNPYRKNNHFLGGVTYEVPSNEDRFVLEVTPPFGEETLTLYASTNTLGKIKKKKVGPVYQVLTPKREVGIGSRGVKLSEKSETANQAQAGAEFDETKLMIRVKK